MPRINIDDSLRNDPRFTALCETVKKHEAYGALVCFWDLGMAYWKDKKGLIPKHVFDLLPFASELLRVGFAELRDCFVYCRGSEEKWEFLTSKAEAGSKGGKASAKARIEKYGTAKPSGSAFKEVSTEALRSNVNYSSSIYNYNKSSSSNINKNAHPNNNKNNSICTPAKAKGASELSKLRDCFLGSWKSKYGRDYPWAFGGKDDAIAKRLLKSFPPDKLFQIVQFYPNWVDSFAVKKSHDFGLISTNLIAIESAMLDQPASLKRNAEARKLNHNPEEYINGLEHDRNIRERLRNIAEKTRAGGSEVSQQSQPRLPERSNHVPDREEIAF